MSNPIALVVAGAVGLILGAVVARKGINIHPAEAVPDSVCYLASTTENPFPVDILDGKRVLSMGYEAGDLFGSIVRAVRPAPVPKVP